MPVNPADAPVLGALYGTEAMRAAVGEMAFLQRMLDVEAALARAQAGLGIVPAGAATAITAAARAERLDLPALAAATRNTGYPVVGLVRQLTALAGPEAGRWTHWGATTQDIMDTAVVLQMRDGFALLDADLARLNAALGRLARAHRDTVMAGRTHLQHALPITFGFKCALWLSAIRRHRDHLARLSQDVRVVQFGGAVGTLASLGDDGIRVLSALAEELDLAVPPIAWHVARDGLAEAVCFLGLLTGSLGKIATDIALLMQAEIGEAAEPYQEGRGGSSTMPQKRNPIACEFVLACARNVRQLVPVMLDAMVQDHERATGPWHAEWIALPQAFALTAGALHHARTMLEGLVVDPGRMRRNLDVTRGMISAEAVMMALAPEVGREQAHHLAAAACQRALANDRHLLEEVQADEAITAHLAPERLAELLDPAGYTGLAGEFVDRVLAREATRSD
jgi:3-carboxy-cis,cis-muconate cycloisomerase